MGIEISLCMIVKNEEHNLGNCLDSIHDLMDEIIIVDTGSTDKTIEVASKYTDKIYHFDWINDFSAARNYSFSKATKEYVMWLDADDIIEEESRTGLKNLKKNLDKKVDIVLMDYRHGYDDDGHFSMVMLRERLFKRSKGFKWKNKVHEVIDFDQNKVNLLICDIYVTHTQSIDSKKSFQRNLQIIEKAIKNNTYGLQEAVYHGTTLFGLGRYDEALEALNNYFDMIGNSNASPNIEAYMLASKIYLKKDDFENAFQVLEENENYFKDKSEYYTSLGNFAKDVLTDYESASFYYEKALKCKGTNFKGGIATLKLHDYYYFKPYYGLGMCHNMLGNYKKAQEAFEAAAKYKETEDLKEMLEITKGINTLLKKAEQS